MPMTLNGYAKAQSPSSILLFRMGDFYELVMLAAAPVFELALTCGDKGKNGFPMAGFPHHAPAYIAKLIACLRIATKWIIRRWLGIVKQTSRGS